MNSVSSRISVVLYKFFKELLKDRRLILVLWEIHCSSFQILSNKNKLPRGVIFQRRQEIRLPTLPGYSKRGARRRDLYSEGPDGRFFFCDLF